MIVIDLEELVQNYLNTVYANLDAIFEFIYKWGTICVIAVLCIAIPLVLCEWILNLNKGGNNGTKKPD